MILFSVDMDIHLLFLVVRFAGTEKKYRLVKAGHLSIIIVSLFLTHQHKLPTSILEMPG